MRITRREFFKYCTIAAGALGLTSADLLKLKDLLAKESATPVVWLQGASCTGDSTSLLNTMFYTDPVGLLITNSDSQSINLKFHQTVMNASGSDLFNHNDVAIDDAVDAAMSVLGTASDKTYAEWSSETWSGGSESIKLKIEFRDDETKVAYAEVTPEVPVLINEFNINFKFKTGESQAPFVELDLLNQDTGATATVSSMYPEVWDKDEGSWESIQGPTDWTSVSLGNLPYWQVTGGAGVSPPGPTPPVPPGIDWITGKPSAYAYGANAPVDFNTIVMPTPGNETGFWYQSTTVDGTLTGAGEPTWNLAPPKINEMIADGDVKWRTIAPNPALVDPPSPWTRWNYNTPGLPSIREQFGTWIVDKVRIIDQGDPGVWISSEDDFHASCTMYVDDIWITGVYYEDRSSFITLYPSVAVDAGIGFVLAIEGSIMTGTPPHGQKGQYCETGPMVPGSIDETMLTSFLAYARNAAAVVAIGTCASFGGIPKLGGAKLGQTNAKGCAQVLKENGIKTPVINVPGCPAHPDWIVGTLVAFLVRGLDGISLDKNLRPLDFYGGYVCNGNEGQIASVPDDNACPWRYNNDGFINAQFPKRGSDGVADDATIPYGIGESKGLAKYKWGSVPDGEEYWDATTGSQPYGAGHMFEGCLGVLGCRGRKTHADCAYRKWNAQSTLTPGTLGVNWCVGSRGGCQGCTEPDFPMLKRFYTFV